MTDDTSRVPKLRFPGFTGAWEQRKLDGYLDEYTEKTTSEDQYPVLTSSQQQGIVFQTDYFANRQVTTSENIGYYVLPRGYFTYRSRSDNGIFKFNRNDLIDFGIISYFYPVFKIDNGDSNFFMQILNHSIIRQVDLESVGTGQRVLSMKKLRNIRTRIPSLDEQKKIGSLFSHLNNTIALHQRKLSHLRQLKKGLLQKMFPKSGEDRPEVRFPGFADAWEQRKVGELLTERNKQEPASDDYPLMAFIANEGVAPKGDRYDRSALVSDSKNKKYKKTELGDFIYSSNNLETGSIGLNRYGRASISPVYSIFHPTNVADSNFLGRRLVRRDFINAMVRWRQGVVYGQWRIHESDFIKIQLSVPVIEEQRAIGTFLDTFDDLITLHQRKLSHLQQQKKALLQQMFV